MLIPRGLRVTSRNLCSIVDAQPEKRGGNLRTHAQVQARTIHVDGLVRGSSMPPGVWFDVGVADRHP